jgi:hypothetical protein
LLGKDTKVSNALVYSISFLHLGEESPEPVRRNFLRDSILKYSGPSLFDSAFVHVSSEKLNPKIGCLLAQEFKQYDCQGIGFFPG